MTTILVSVDGILAQNPATDSILNYESSGSGRVFYDMLKTTCRIIFLSSDPYEERVVAWLIRERFNKYAGLYCHPVDSGMTAEEWKVLKAKELIGIGHHIHFFFSANPDTVKGGLEAGINSVLVAYSSVTPGESHALKESYSPWDTLVESIDEQVMLKAEKAARSEDDGTS